MIKKRLRNFLEGNYWQTLKQDVLRVWTYSHNINPNTINVDDNYQMLKMLVKCSKYDINGFRSILAYRGGVLNKILQKKTKLILNQYCG